jgi:uncharacterized repeat protein (TIGR03803 family)
LDGGAAGWGTVFAVNTDGTGFTTLYSFTGGNDGANPFASLIQLSDGRLYGTASLGGADWAGTVFAIKTDGTGFIALHSFKVTDGANPYATLTQGSDGRLYGTAFYGGADWAGTVFAVNTDGTGITTFCSFNGTDGSRPCPQLIQGRDGQLYGMTFGGGTNGDGTIYVMGVTIAPPSIVTQPLSFTTIGGTTPALFSIVADGTEPFTSQWQESLDGGVTWSDLVDNGNFSGSLTLTLTVSQSTVAMSGYQFRCVVTNPSQTTVTSEAATLAVVATSPSIVAQPISVTTISGTTPAHFSVAVDGTAPLSYQWQESTDSGITWSDLADNGTYSGSLTSILTVNQATAVMSGYQFRCVVTNPYVPPATTNSATLIVAAEQPFTAIYKFTGGANGANPWASLIQGSDGRLYGTTWDGGVDGAGTVFAVNADGTGYTTLYSVTGGADGANPAAALIQGSDGRLFGTTLNYGTGPGGTVFAVNTDGTGFNILHTFSGYDDVLPRAGLLQGKDGRLYGTAEGFEPYGYGIVYALNTDGTGFTTLYTFTGGTDGDAPYGSLIQGSDGRLYGTASSGGADGQGTVFALNTDGTGFTALYAFTGGADGGVPLAGLIEGSDSRLYGTASSGGTGGNGTVFSMNTEGTGFATLHSFTGGSDGASPQASLIQLSDGRLYGTTWGGGAIGYGVLFAVKNDGTGFTMLYSFGNDGAESNAGLILGSDGRLYGTAYTAGSNGNGSIFAYKIGLLGPPITMQVATQTLNLGSTVVLTGLAPEATSYQWEFNGVPLSNSAAGTSINVVSGATGPQLVISNATGASSGGYTLVATNAAGWINTGVVTLQVAASSTPGTLSSISSRAFVGTGDNILIGGFYIVGSTSATVLVQAIGPALAAAPYNVTGTLQKPALFIHESQNGKDVVLYSNTGWGSSPVLLAAAAAVYAQPVLVPNAADSEVLLTLPLRWSPSIGQRIG